MHRDSGECSNAVAPGSFAPRRVAQPLLLLCACAVTALNPPPRVRADEEDGKADRLELMRSAAGAYQITVATDDGPEELTLRPEPLLRWTNPIRRTTDGTVFLWTHNERPAAVLCMYPHLGALDHEFQSLAEGPLTAHFEGSDSPDWTPREPGVTFRPVPEGPSPAASSAARLSQMRGIARRFRALFGERAHEHELRLLTQPLYRYPAKGSAESDGAIFAFVQGTDPEILLILEIRKAADGHPRWHYAAARMTVVNLHLEYQEQPIWSAAWHSQSDREKAYICLSRRTPLPGE